MYLSRFISSPVSEPLGCYLVPFLGFLGQFRLDSLRQAVQNTETGVWEIGCGLAPDRSISPPTCV